MNNQISTNVVPSFESFRQLARHYNRIPVNMVFQSDLETPLSVYLKLGGGSNSFLLESVEKNEQVARYSFMGFSPTGVYVAKNGFLTYCSGAKKKEVKSANPLQDIKGKVSGIRQAPLEGSTGGFLGGLVGFVGYDAVRYFEKLPSQKPDVLDLPDLFLMVADQLVLFDHLKRTFRLIVNVPLKPNINLKKAHREAVQRLSALAKKLEKPLRGVVEIPVMLGKEEGQNDLSGFKSEMTREAFQNMVVKSKEYVKAGDIIQVVGSQRFRKTVKTDAVTIYRILRRLNPSPYMFLLRADGVDLVGASPEMMIRVQNGMVETRPIAGTRPRGKTAEEDLRMEESLLADEKELAEHTMLVDLARNDLGRVCDYGTVKMEHFKRIERYSHVMHIVSDVTGRLQKGKTAYDAFQSCFPAGTLSGAPKIRAMEIIEEMELSRRGIYGGAVTAFGFDGNMDSAITIRSAVLKRKGQKTTAYVQAGAGLVADSVPENEYMETCNKARVVFMAIDQAEKANFSIQRKACSTRFVRSRSNAHKKRFRIGGRP